MTTSTLSNSTSAAATDPGETISSWLVGDEDALDLAARMIEILREVPGVRSLDDQQHMEVAAWAAIALRRGRRDGNRVTLGDIIGLGLDPEVVQVAWVVGGHHLQKEEPQRQTAMATSPMARIVFVVYWISRVTQARDGMKRSTWKTLGARAHRETAGVAAGIPDPMGTRLRERVDYARW